MRRDWARQRDSRPGPEVLERQGVAHEPDLWSVFLEVDISNVLVAAPYYPVRIRIVTWSHGQAQAPPTRDRGLLEHHLLCPGQPTIVGRKLAHNSDDDDDDISTRILYPLPDGPIR